ncbi:MAG: putative Ig domain-containing protein [Armatimonadota bacterium]|jgi:hypothetical protein
MGRRCNRHNLGAATVKTLVVSVTVVSVLGVLAIALVAPKPERWVPIGATAQRQHTEIIRESARQYTISMGGTVDAENTCTRSHNNFRIGFQPNVSLTIENTGDAPVVNPKLIVNDRRDWGTVRSIMREFTRGAESDEEKAYLIWQGMRENTYHDLPLFPGRELHDPVKMLNVYGLGLCDDVGGCACSLYSAAGIRRPRAPRLRVLGGHLQGEPWIEGDFRLLDIDRDVFYLDRENERPVSSDALARDHDLARREVHYGPVFRGWDSSARGSAVFGADDRDMRRLAAGHTMRMTLRPGEKVVFRWDHIGKAPFAPSWPPPNRQPPARGRLSTQPEEPFLPRFFGNSKFIYEPRLDVETLADGTESHSDIVAATAPEHAGRFAGGSQDAHLTYRIETPYVICGGRIEAQFHGLADDDSFSASISVDGETWEELWRASGPGSVTLARDTDDLLHVHEPPAEYSYLVRIGLHSAAEGHGANLCSLKIATDVMAAPLSLPGLRLGDNAVRYTDDTEGPHEVAVTHAWQESDAVTAPEPPAQTIYPEPDVTIRDSILTFRWPEVEGCRRYHIQVSRRPDMRIPYRPSYDVVIKQNEWCVPFTGMFSPDVIYHWRVRARDRHGVWSRWSPVWRFRWEGPCVPLDVTRETTGQEIRIRWRPNPRGSRSGCYEVYGSDEKGFSISKEPYEVMGLGRVPGNYVGTTTNTEMLVVTPEPDLRNMNRCYYRVVAVDAHGTQSGCSDYVEMPHPFIYTRPVAEAKVGEPYEYRPKTIMSLGDLQYRLESRDREFRDREEYTFSLVTGSKWLDIDPETGALTGTPSSSDLGTANVRVAVENQFGGSATHAYRLAVRGQ